MKVLQFVWLQIQKTDYARINNVEKLPAYNIQRNIISIRIQTEKTMIALSSELTMQISNTNGLRDIQNVP